MADDIPDTSTLECSSYSNSHPKSKQKSLMKVEVQYVFLIKRRKKPTKYDELAHSTLTALGSP